MEEVSWLQGSLATAQKTRTVAEGYSRVDAVSGHRHWSVPENQAAMRREKDATPFSLYALSVDLGDVAVTLNETGDRGALLEPDHLASA